jgi:hypothetical protein
VWLFNANNFGNSERGGDKIYGPGLPDEFYIDATPVAPYVKLKFDPVFLWLFSGMHGAALVVLWVLFFWAVVSTRALPAISSYPLFDIFFKSEIGGNIPASEASIPLAGDRRVLELTKDATVHAKVIESGFRAI